MTGELSLQREESSDHPHLESIEAPHRRYNPLTGEWLLVSPQRVVRPWQGHTESMPERDHPVYAPDCYLCPGNVRTSGKMNPCYESTYVFDNDFPAFLPDAAHPMPPSQDLFKVESVQGICRVICFSPHHNLTLPEMDVDGIEMIVETWIDQTAKLGRRFRWVQVFENKGDAMGCSNPHPHGQIWASDSIPHEPAAEDRHQKVYYQKHKVPLLTAYCEEELRQQARIITQNPYWLAVVPFWAVWPYETLLLPKRHVLRLPDLNTPERAALAQILKILLTKYDNLFNVSFPYSMGWHGAPLEPAEIGQAAVSPGSTGVETLHWQLHAHFYPPLLRSPTIKKFMVGYEMLGEPQRDFTAEQAAGRLRASPEVHYKEDYSPAGDLPGHRL